MGMQKKFTLAGGLGVLCLVMVLSGCNSEMKRARGYTAAKDYEMAAKTYERIIKAEPQNKVAIREVTALYCGDQYRNVFRCYGKAKMFYDKWPKEKGALEWYKKALFTSAYEFSLTSRLKKSRDYLERYLEFEKKDGKALFMLANIKVRLNSKPPVDKDALKSALKMFQQALAFSTPATRIGLSSKEKDALLQWETHMQIGSIHDMFLGAALQKFNKTKKPRVRRRRRRKSEGPKFQPDAKTFAAARAAYEAAGKQSAQQKDRFKKFLPFFKVGLMYANYKSDQKTALLWLEKAEKQHPDAPSIHGNMKMLYDYLADKAKKARNRKLKKTYEEKAKEYAEKFRKSRQKMAAQKK